MVGHSNLIPVFPDPVGLFEVLCEIRFGPTERVRLAFHYSDALRSIRDKDEALRFLALTRSTIFSTTGVRVLRDYGFLINGPVEGYPHVQFGLDAAGKSLYLQNLPLPRGRRSGASDI